MVENKNVDLHMRVFPYRVSEVRNLEAERRALHEEIEIKCFYEGTSVLIVGENKIEVHAGDIVVINPYEFHVTINSGSDNETGKYHLFMIPLDFFANNGVDDLELRALLLGNNMVLKTLFQNDKRMFKILSRIIKEYQDKKRAYNIAIVGLLMEFFSILLREGLTDAEKVGNKKNNLRLYKSIEPAIRHIRDNFQEEITIDDLSTLCHMNKHYFCRAFKTLTEKTAMEYLKEYRLKIANIMLSDFDKSIEYIAEYCGFKSISYFCRSYKDFFGYTPTQHRRK